MGWFGRKRKQEPTTNDPIAAFWQWWSSASAEIDAAATRRDTDRVVELLGTQVRALHPELVWEMGPYDQSRHQLIVSAGGDPELRPLARRWLRAAPPADEAWTFFDMRQPSPLNMVLELGDVTMTFADVRVHTARTETGLDVVVYHPVFGEVSEEQRVQLMFMALDAALGEKATELWLDRVETSVTDPEGSAPLGELPSIVDAVEAESMPNGEMGWTMLEGDSPDGPILVRCLQRLSPVQALDFDQHVSVVVRFSDVTAEGWPGPRSMEALARFENDLAAAVFGKGQVVAVHTRSGVRVLEFYVDSTTDAAEVLQTAAKRWRQGKVEIEVDLDPGWEAVQAFRI
ncbi:DUF695 domain-containing protein [Enemella sp. A6]|uniref:DUF695 domain-containing protein n=1 Tax=Enemella sp. A6 TaxID=3440152 RepID=UPI003EBCF206